MRIISAFEATTHFGELLARVARGEEIVITRYEKPVARLIPEGGRDLEKVREGVRKLRELHANMRKRGFKPLTNKEIVGLIHEGRRR